MASRKRSRDAHDVDSALEVESVSSSLQQVHHKRSRVTMAHEQGGSVVSDEEDGEVDGSGYDTSGGHNDHTAADTAFRPNSMTDDEDIDEDGDDNEFDELRGTQIVEKQLRRHQDNIASEEGIIEEVFCRNFMCHSKLRIKLGPLINFIIGHNGSGKSAVLTALTMCLGGKATATNRGGSLKSLIKIGEESATLAVKIKNRGDGAYKTDLYGNSITVERHFSRSGTSTFKIKNAEDKIVTTKKADLDDILDFFAFQLDNPINVLTQDMARQFLSNSSASDKYKFFIRGTQLEILDNDYKLLEERLDSMMNKLRSREEDIALLKQKVEQAEAKKRRVDQLESIQQKILATEQMHAWAQIEEQEQVVESCMEEIQLAEQAMQEKQDAAEAVTGIHEGHTQAKEAASSFLQQLNEQLQPVDDDYTAAKANWDINRTRLIDLKAEERRIKEDMKMHKSNIARVKGEIMGEQARLDGAEGTEHSERLAKLEVLKEAVKAAQQRHEDHSQSLDGIQQKRASASEQHEASKLPVTEKRESLHRAEVQLQNIRQPESRPFDGYRSGMGNLVRAIDQETRWHEKPVGPMGRHVRLLDMQWQRQIERIFGGVLESFVCTNRHDQNLLSQIMERVGCQAPTYIGDPTPLNTSSNEPPNGVDTILRILRIDNDLARNSFIINQGIDQYALVRTRTDAQNLVSGAGRVQNVKVAMAFGSVPGTGTRIECSRSGALKSTPVHAWEGRPRMKADLEEQIKAQQEILEHAKRELDAAVQKERQLAIALKNAVQDLNRFKREQTNKTVELQQAESAVEEQQSEIDSNRPQDGRLQELERQLIEAQEALGSTEKSYEDYVNSKDSLDEAAPTLKSRLDAVQKEREEGKARIVKAGKRVESAESARLEALYQKNAALNAVQTAEALVRAAQAKRDQEQGTLDEWTPQAEQVCLRIPVENGVTPAQLMKRIDKFHADLRQRETEAGGTREEITLAWQKAVEDYHEAEGQIVDIKALEKTLSNTLTNRKERWLKFRKFIAARARFTFAYLLSERQFRGRVLLDHHEKLLDIMVEPDLAKNSDAGRETKTLSGGEKSFSTICLLLSIWEAMGSPIRCLDEFDVFMDSVNRATSMSMMIQAARRSVGRQFILITPQSMNNVQLGDDVKIHRMSDPERGQMTLPF